MILRAENITPSILTWARETAGLSVEDAASKLGLKSSAKATATDKLEAYERGDVKPTRNLLLKIASTYRRPVSVFYRLTPPPEGDQGEDFRTLSAAVSNKETALFKAILRDIRTRQDMVKSILEDDEESERKSFIGSMHVSADTENAVRSVQQVLDIDEYLSFRRNLNSPTKLLSALRQKVEDIGVFVLYVGNLGSHHTNVSARVFRGIAIADEIAPFIVINDQDAVPARSFTLIHELVHLLTGSTGVSNAPSMFLGEARKTRVERFCNDVASEFLLPEESFADIQLLTSYTQASETIRQVAVDANISESMTAYRFWRSNRIDDGIYRQLIATYMTRWRNTEPKNNLVDQSNKSGPSYYTVRRHKLGKALISLVGRSLKAENLTHTKAAMILGVNPGNVESLLKGARTESSSFL